MTKEALDLLSPASSSACCPVTLLRLRLRFGSPRDVQCGVAFRVAVDLVDEMAQPPSATKAADGLIIRVELDLASSPSRSPLTLQTRVTRAAPFHWRVDCVVSPASTTPPPSFRLRVTCDSATTGKVPHEALQRFCAGSQWVSLSEQEDAAVALVLPVVSGEIHVREPSSSSASRTTSSRCLREFALPKPHGHVWIEEDYGHAMGSHTWDASVWLSLALLETVSNGKRTVVELGSGCGLVACVFARLHPQSLLIATERRDALSLLQANLSRNGVDSRVETMELVWGSGQVPSIPVLDVVLAADVLYHWEAHEPLLATLSALCEASATRVLIAHTRRSAAAAKRLDDVVATGLDASCGSSPGCAFTTTWRVERLGRLSHRVDLLQLTQRKNG